MTMIVRPSFMQFAAVTLAATVYAQALRTGDESLGSLLLCPSGGGNAHQEGSPGMSVNLEGELVVSEVDYLDLLRSWFGRESLDTSDEELSSPARDSDSES